MRKLSDGLLFRPLVERAGTDPHHNTLTFIEEDGSSERVNAGQFHAAAAAYGTALRAIGIGPQDMVILVLRHSRTLLAAFWGAMYVGAIPSIFPFLTEKLDSSLYFQRVRTLVEHSGARAVITFPEFKDELAALLAGVDCRVLSTDDVSDSSNDPPSPLTERGTGGEAGPGAEVWAEPNPDDIAFLQHSSGTTGLQKGVALSHRAVLNQINAYSKAIALQPDDVIVSWLPLYHDMGLIAGFVMPLVAGIPLVMMSPFHWVRDPKILFRAIHEYRGTLVWLPNFAYNHCARAVRPRDMEGIDLSHWRAVINCSEPVRDDSHRMFAEAFAPFGFRREALSACYAMAENVFAVTQTEIGRPPDVDWIVIDTFQREKRAVPAEPDAPGAMAVVSCGAPVAGTEVAVAGPDGQHLPERHEGEIILRGDSMLSGYYRREDATAESIREGWYYTGDRGYIADGQVYISGRKKDMIIIGGKNVYPQDLEAIANVVPGIHPGRAVAFGVFDDRVGSEGVVLVCELENAASPEEQHAIVRDLRLRVAQQTEVALGDVKLVDRKWMIKTSSGKIARNDNREKYLREFKGR